MIYVIKYGINIFNYVLKIYLIHELVVTSEWCPSRVRFHEKWRQKIHSELLQLATVQSNNEFNNLII